MPRLKLIEMDSFKKLIYFRKDDKLIAFDADVAIELISDSLDGKYAPVKHGHWEIDMRGNWACSLCGNDPYHDNMKNMNYCPNCGAKMDERREDETN